MARPDGDDEDLAEIDLHGCTPQEALRRLSQGLHSARVLGAVYVKVITGRGWGNREQQPVLLPRVEQWLGGPEGRRHGVMAYERTSKDGALMVRLIRQRGAG